MKKTVAVFIAVAILFCGCVSSDKKALVRNTVEEYFAFLTGKEYEKANAMVIEAEENIIATIEESSVNNLIFKDISYEIWDIYEKDQYLCAEIVVTQLSLKAAFIDTVKEYNDYVTEAEKSNKSFTDEALEDKWDEFFYNHVAKTTETVSLKCEVKILSEAGKNPKILMTGEFRNCLFGGELDAINSLKTVNEGE